MFVEQSPPLRASIAAGSCVKMPFCCCTNDESDTNWRAAHPVLHREHGCQVHHGDEQSFCVAPLCIGVGLQQSREFF